MRFSVAGVAAAALFIALPAAAQVVQSLTLDEAFERTIRLHPDLDRFRYLQIHAQAGLAEAEQTPPFSIGMDVENIGSGSRSGTDQAEVTLSLSSVLERGGKREARRSVATAQMQTLSLEQQARRLDILAEVGRRYLEVVATQALVGIAEAELERRKHLVELATARVRAGASPESVRLSAEAAVARAHLTRQRATADIRASSYRLAALWNDRTGASIRPFGDLLELPSAPTLESLRALLDRSPELRRFADESRLREARLQLANSARSFDIQWSAGVRRLEETHDWAVVAGFTVPLGSDQRAQPRVRAAQADIAALALERESEEISLYATLVEAQTRMSAASAEVATARDDVLPRLEAAEREAERAYRAGATSYLELAELQREMADARREQLNAALEGHRALIEIQRLTAEPFTQHNTAVRPEVQP
jgi:outer membrane protein, heavy metal efflux system